jgi:hypothetical protein
VLTLNLLWNKLTDYPIRFPRRVIDGLVKNEWITQEPLDFHQGGRAKNCRLPKN